MCACVCICMSVCVCVSACVCSCSGSKLLFWHLCVPLSDYDVSERLNRGSLLLLPSGPLYTHSPLALQMLPLLLAPFPVPLSSHPTTPSPLSPLPQHVSSPFIPHHYFPSPQTFPPFCLCDPLSTPLSLVPPSLSPPLQLVFPPACTHTLSGNGESTELSSRHQPLAAKEPGEAAVPGQSPKPRTTPPTPPPNRGKIDLSYALSLSYALF